MRDPAIVEINDLLQVKLVDDPNGLSYRSRVEDVRSEGIFISWPTDRGMLVPIKVECVLSLSLVRDDAAYTFTASVEGSEREPLPCLRVRALGPPERIQRRHYFRSKVIVPVELAGKVPSSSNDSDEVKVIRTSTYDLGGGGVSIRVASSLPVGTTLETQLSLPDGLPPIRVPLRVAYREVAVVPSNNQNLNRIGMNFLAISEADRTRIIKYLFKAQRKQLS